MLTLLLLLGCQELLTPEESRAARAVAAAVVKAGFPDAKGASVLSGRLVVRATFDPDTESCPLPSHASDFQATVPDSTRVTYGFTFDGLHLKLADGTWLIGLTHRFKPREGDLVNEAKAAPVDLRTITAEAAKAHPFDAETEASEWIDRLVRVHRDRVTRALDRFVPVSHFLTLDHNDWAPAIVLLHAAGWPDAVAASLVIADRRARDFWQMRPWIEPDFVFDPRGRYPSAERSEGAWKEANPLLTPEAPHVALRRALYRWCQAQIQADFPMIPPDVAAAACKAALDPGDPQKHAARVDGLLAGSRLPQAPPEGANLAARLASWEARERKPRMTFKSVKDGDKTRITTSFEIPVPAYQPERGDLDALVGLLADDRPSRFSDFSGPRTVGDNAWRAVATLLEADPREPAGHPTDRPWTAAERASAAAAVQRWWKSNREKRIER